MVVLNSFTYRQIEEKQLDEQRIKEESLRDQQQLDDLRQDCSQWEGQARNADRKIKEIDMELR